MFERFTDRARRVVVLAQVEARSLNHNYIGTEHILLGLIHEGDGVAAKALESVDISLGGVRNAVEEIIGQGVDEPTGHIPFTPRAKKVLELSLREALGLGHNYIGTEHILLGLLREGQGVAAQVLIALGADLQRIRRVVIGLLQGHAGPSGEPVDEPERLLSLLNDPLAAGSGRLKPEEIREAAAELLDRGRRARSLAEHLLSQGGMDDADALDLILGMLVDPYQLRRNERRVGAEWPRGESEEPPAESSEES